MREAGIIMLCLMSGGCVGALLSLRLKQRANSLNRLISMLYDIEGYIAIGNYSLAEIFHMLGKSGCDILDCHDLSESARQGKFSDRLCSLSEEIPYLSLEDKEILKGFAARAGKSDRDSQLSLIRLTVSGLDTRLKGAVAEYDSKGALYRRLGILLGAMVGIMLL